MDHEGIGGALGRFNKTLEHNEPEGDEKEEKSEGGGEGKGHTFHVHKHTDGKHHLTVHGEHGKLMHHSEHESLEEAADEMKQHGGD